MTGVTDRLTVTGHELSRTAAIVPRGVWHRAIVHGPCDVLRITPGAGTRNRPVEG